MASILLIEDLEDSVIKPIMANTIGGIVINGSVVLLDSVRQGHKKRYGIMPSIRRMSLVIADNFNRMGRRTRAGSRLVECVQLL
ncbi:hypothetical protein EON65_22270 [archaeon]|nr:MAG: hypothetical protein EON65_22270 [archaeon]